MPPERPILRVVVDSNVIIRATLSSRGASAQFLQALKQGRFTCITSLQHLTEIYDVLGRPRITRKYRVSPRQRKRGMVHWSVIDDGIIRGLHPNATGRLPLSFGSKRVILASRWPIFPVHSNISLERGAGTVKAWARHPDVIRK
ncbi:MAG: putative toxin-antitoxin system toxin component, PIN family [Anaerolineae bacterium]